MTTGYNYETEVDARLILKDQKQPWALLANSENC